MDKKCIIVPQEEYNTWLENENNYKNLQKQYEELKTSYEKLESDYNELKKEHPNLDIHIVNEMYKGSSYTDEKPYMSHFSLYFGGNSTILPSESLKGKIREICNSIYEKVSTQSKEVIDKCYQDKLDYQKNEYRHLNDYCNKLLNIIYKHNSECWFKKNKITIPVRDC